MKKMSDTSESEEPDRKVQLKEFHFQRRVLFGCTIGLFFALLLWTIAILTNNWFLVRYIKDTLYFTIPQNNFIKILFYFHKNEIMQA